MKFYEYINHEFKSFVIKETVGKRFGQNKLPQYIISFCVAVPLIHEAETETYYVTITPY